MGKLYRRSRHREVWPSDIDPSLAIGNIPPENSAIYDEKVKYYFIWWVRKRGLSNGYQWIMPFKYSRLIYRTEEEAVDFFRSRAKNSRLLAGKGKPELRAILMTGDCKGPYGMPEHSEVRDLTLETVNGK